MPVALSLPLDKTEVLNAVHNWIDLLAAENYASAYHSIIHDPYYEWTPELMECIINGYGLHYEEGEQKFFVSDWRTASGDPGSQDISIFSQLRDQDIKIFSHGEDIRGSLGEIWFDLPLNGTWSDLTATFRIVPHMDKATLVLEEIHVF